ncbi:MAG: MFS transporter [Proteobacteria bacterium]|nr:MFS transporter [Pseudomonadota bacterium]
MSNPGMASPLVRWYVLAVTCLIYTINIADRYVVSTVLEPIRTELRLSDRGVGFLTGVPLGLFYVTLGLPISWLADRSNRRNILGICVILWSGFTALCGRTQTYLQFLLARIGVGTGEAGGTPTSNSLLADYFAPERRPMAFTVFALGAPLGAWLGADVAGAVANAYGWRASFLALGVPGLVIGLLVLLTIREPVRGGLDAGTVPQRASMAESLRFLWRQRAAFHVIMGSGVCSLWGWGLIWWTPTFLMRTYGLDVGQAGAITGNIHLVAGVVASIGTAWLFSLPVMLDARRVCWVLAGGTALATIPSFIAYWTHSLEVARIMFWLFIPAIYFYIGPCMALVQNTAACHMRTVFSAWSGLCGNVFNLIVAPQLVGLLSDAYAGGGATDATSLRFALLLLAPTGFWAAYHLYAASRTIIQDQTKASNYVGMPAL